MTTTTAYYAWHCVGVKCYLLIMHHHISIVNMLMYNPNQEQGTQCCQT